VLSAMLVAVTAGCTAADPAVREMSQAVVAWQRPQVRADGGGATSTTPSMNRKESSLLDLPQAVSPAGAESRLQVYLRDVLERNPSIAAAKADVRAKLERVAQVTSWSDPVLRAVFRPEPIQTAAGDAGFTLGVSQKLPLPARLGRAGEMAVAAAHAAVERLNGVRLDLIADVERAYFDLYLLDRSIELTQAHVISLEDLEAVLSAQYRVGKVEQQDLLRTHTELAKLRDDQERLRRQRLASAVALNGALDYAPSREIPLTTPVTLPALAIDVGELIALANENNPELGELAYEIKREQAAVELTRLGYWPDTTVGFEWTHVDPRKAFEPPINPQTARRPVVSRKSKVGDDNWAFVLQFNVPIWRNRIESAKREAAQKLQQTVHDRRAALNAIESRVFDAWSRVQTHQDTANLLESTLIPQARQTYEVSLTAYQAGKSDFLNVIDNWRRLLGFELMYHREVVGLRTSFSELERVVGVQLTRVEATSNRREPREQP